MKWNLSVEINNKPSYNPIEYEQKIMLLGSCFSENIGALLKVDKFQTLNNPFGILYNPKSICAALLRIIENDFYKEEELVHYNNLWLSFDHHSSFSHSEKEVALKNINNKINKANKFINTSNTIIITLGSAFYYQLKNEKKVVGNCHKYSASYFDRKKLTSDEIISDFSRIIDLIKKKNSKLQWVFTVSPVRHWKDGAVDNNWSKSTLICGIQELVNNNDSLHYFPSYEIMMDELRDYRFYKEDMLHPSDQAIAYIWNVFKAHNISDASNMVQQQIEEIRRACSHKPFNFSSEKHQLFISTTERKIESLKNKFQYLNFSTELNQLKGTNKK